MKIPVFLSYAKPHLKEQQKFIDAVCSFLKDRGLNPRTLGVTDYSWDAPLTAIRRLMLECNGVVAIAFRRTYVEKGRIRANVNVPDMKDQPIADVWWTSPWCHIEPAMAYQIGLPVLIFREKGVAQEGVLENGTVGTYMPEFDLTKPIKPYFRSAEWNDLISRWEGFVRNVVEAKGQPPKLY